MGSRRRDSCPRPTLGPKPGNGVGPTQEHSRGPRTESPTHPPRNVRPGRCRHHARDRLSAPAARIQRWNPHHRRAATLRHLPAGTSSRRSLRSSPSNGGPATPIPSRRRRIARTPREPPTRRHGRILGVSTRRRSQAGPAGLPTKSKRTSTVGPPYKSLSAPRTAEVSRGSSRNRHRRSHAMTGTSFHRPLEPPNPAQPGPGPVANPPKGAHRHATPNGTFKNPEGSAADGSARGAPAPPYRELRGTLGFDVPPSPGSRTDDEPPKTIDPARSQPRRSPGPKSNSRGRSDQSRPPSPLEGPVEGSHVGGRPEAR